jgi:putative ABC transport system permease protein|tara:strand:- start:757 stop:2022 length:1266 start_codon:yes stop_codon:yes gene_type:complete
MIILRLAWQSLMNRKFTTILTILSIAVSVMLLLGVEKVRSSARTSFINTISGTDLVVGARTGGVQLLLYSVFHIGDATANVTWKTVEDIKKRDEVKWIVPIALGDSHRGYRVVGTSSEYFERFRYRRNIPLQFVEGYKFSDLFDAVLGAEVARTLNYKIDDEIILAHGTGPVSIGKDHGDTPFRVSGILAPTGTPVDRVVHVSMEAIEAIHLGWETGAYSDQSNKKSAEELRKIDLSPKAATAVYVGLKSRMTTFSLQRWINTYKQEPIIAILPGVVFGELWSMIGNIEKVLLIISTLVVLTAILGMIISILASLNERRREMAILRAIGAKPIQIFTLFTAEATTIAFLGVVIGFFSLYSTLFIIQPFIENLTGLYLDITLPKWNEIILMVTIMGAAVLAGIIPALRAYRTSLSDGLMIRG